MKIFFYTVLVNMLLFISCSKDEYVYTYQGDTYVQLLESEGTYNVLDNDSTRFIIKVQIIGVAPQNDITLLVSYPDTATLNDAGVYSTIHSGIQADSIVTIKAGSYNGEITIRGNYSSLENGKIDTLLIQLNDGDAKADIYNRVYLLKIQKFHPYVEEEYPGVYTGTYTGKHIGGWNIEGTVDTDTSGLVIALGEEPNTLVITSGFYQEQLNEWGESWVDGPVPVVLYMNNDDPDNYKVEILGGIHYWGVTDTESNAGPYEYWLGPHESPGGFNTITKTLTIKFRTYYEGPTVENDEGIYEVILTDEQADKLIYNR